MILGHDVDEQQLLHEQLVLAHVLVHALGPAPQLQRLVQLITALAVDVADQRQVHGHHASHALVGGHGLLAGGQVLHQVGGVAHAQLDAAQALVVAAGQVLQVGAEEAQLERQAAGEQRAHGVDPLVALQLPEPHHHVLLALDHDVGGWWLIVCRVG